MGETSGWDILKTRVRTHQAREQQEMREEDPERVKEFIELYARYIP